MPGRRPCAAVFRFVFPWFSCREIVIEISHCIDFRLSAFAAVIGFQFILTELNFVAVFPFENFPPGPCSGPGRACRDPCHFGNFSRPAAGRGGLSRRGGEAGAAVFRGRPDEEQYPGKSALGTRSEEHTSELQSLMRISYAVFCLLQTINLKLQT